MDVYILFLYGDFDDHSDIEFFCTEILGSESYISSIKYVIESSKNIIIIFESESGEDLIIDKLPLSLINDHVNYYFLFKTQDLILSYLPDKIRDLIFKPLLSLNKIKYEIPASKELNLDDLLEKINKHGIVSLSEEEKKFLDDFGN